MKRVKLLMSVVLFFTMVELSSCHQDDPYPSKTALLSRTWKVTGAKVADLDVFASWDECKKDNLYTFAKNGSFTLDEGATKCEQSSPQKLEGTWSMQNNLIVFSDNLFLEPQTISVLSKTTLKVTYTVPVNAYVYELTFTAQ